MNHSDRNPYEVWSELVSRVAHLEVEAQRLRRDLDMLAEERDAWKARAMGLPQEPCRHLE